jgi:hypothetical protein
LNYIIEFSALKAAGIKCTSNVIRQERMPVPYMLILFKYEECESMASSGSVGVC